MANAEIVSIVGNPSRKKLDYEECNSQRRDVRLPVLGLDIRGGEYRLLEDLWVSTASTRRKRVADENSFTAN